MLYSFDLGPFSFLVAVFNFKYMPTSNLWLRWWTMVDYIEITEHVLLQSNIPAIAEKFRSKARSYKFVRDASLKFNSVKGTRISADRFHFDADGEVSVDMVGMPSLLLRFSGAGEYKREERRVYLTALKILNDVGGFANKLIEVTGVGVGRSVHVNEHDNELLLSLFPEVTV